MSPSASRPGCGRDRRPSARPQEGRFFRGYYDGYCRLWLYVLWGGYSGPTSTLSRESWSRKCVFRILDSGPDARRRISPAIRCGCWGNRTCSTGTPRGPRWGSWPPYGCRLRPRSPSQGRGSRWPSRQVGAGSIQRSGIHPGSPQLQDINAWSGIYYGSDENDISEGTAEVGSLRHSNAISVAHCVGERSAGARTLAQRLLRPAAFGTRSGHGW